MAQDWYYQLLGEETGPISFESLQDLVREGHLNGDDVVRTSTSDWMRAELVSGLFSPGEITEPEEATDLDLNLLLSSSSAAPVPLSPKRRALQEAMASAARNTEEWFYSLLGQEVGPVSFDDMIEQIQLGSLQSDDRARRGREGDWQPLASFSQFANVLAKMQPKPEWYCRILGQVLGPMMFDELQHMTESNSLNLDDEVRFGEAGDWGKARQTRGLKFPQATAASTGPSVKLSTHAPFGEAATKKEWFYEILGQQLGPISFQELARAVADGSLQLEDKARRGQHSAWGLVLDVPGLISVEQKAAYLAAKQEASRPRPIAPAPIATPATVVPPPPQPKPAVKPPVTESQSTVKPNVPTSPPPVPAAPLPPPVRTPSPPMGSAPPMPSSRPASLPPKFKPPVKGGKSAGFKINGKIVGAIAGVLLLVGVVFGLSKLGISFGSQPGQAEYEKVKVIWDEAQKIHTSSAKAADWAGFKTKHEAEVKKLEKEITDQKPGATKRLLQLMYFCTRNHLPAIMADGNEMRFKAMDKDMKEAAKLASP